MAVILGMTKTTGAGIRPKLLNQKIIIKNIEDYKMRATDKIKGLANSIEIYEKSIVECEGIISKYHGGEDIIKLASNLGNKNHDFLAILHTIIFEAVTDYGEACQRSISKIEEKFENGQTKNLTQYIIED